MSNASQLQIMLNCMAVMMFLLLLLLSTFYDTKSVIFSPQSTKSRPPYKKPSIISPKPLLTTTTTMPPMAGSVSTGSNSTVPILPLACSFGQGRLGNQLSSFATLYALEKEYHVKGVLNPHQVGFLKNFLETEHFLDVMPNLADFCPQWNKEKWIKSYPKTTVSNRTGWPTAEVGHFIDIGLYPVDFFFFKKYIPELRELFQLKTRLVDEAKRRLSNAISESGVDRNNNLTLVSIHVRRTDYAHHLQVLFDLKYVEEEYFKNATDYYKNKFNNIFFYAISDDPDWVKSTLVKMYPGRIFYIGSGDDDGHNFSEEEKIVFDLALLSQADHAIMTYGTFALWGTLLSGDGLVLLPKSHKRGDVSLDIENAKMDRFIFI